MSYNFFTDSFHTKKANEQKHRKKQEMVHDDDEYDCQYISVFINSKYQ